MKLKGPFSWEEGSVSCPSSQTLLLMMPRLPLLLPLQRLTEKRKQKPGLALERRPLQTGTEAEVLMTLMVLRMKVGLMLTRVRRVMVWTLREVMKSWKDVEGIG